MKNYFKSEQPLNILMVSNIIIIIIIIIYVVIIMIMTLQATSEQPCQPFAVRFIESSSLNRKVSHHGLC